MFKDWNFRHAVAYLPCRAQPIFPGLTDKDDVGSHLCTLRHTRDSDEGKPEFCSFVFLFWRVNSNETLKVTRQPYGSDGSSTIAPSICLKNYLKDSILSMPIRPSAQKTPLHKKKIHFLCPKQYPWPLALMCQLSRQRHLWRVQEDPMLQDNTVKEGLLLNTRG